MSLAPCLAMTCMRSMEDDSYLVSSSDINKYKNVQVSLSQKSKLITQTQFTYIMLLVILWPLCLHNLARMTAVLALCLPP